MIIIFNSSYNQISALKNCATVGICQVPEKYAKSSLIVYHPTTADEIISMIARRLEASSNTKIKLGSPSSNLFSFGLRRLAFAKFV
jgi:hypothetical protein